MSNFKEHEDTSRLWCLAVLNTVDTDTLAKILTKYLEIRDNDPDLTLATLRVQSKISQERLDEIEEAVEKLKE